MNSNSRPLVSIVISVYRRDHYLPLAIRSALSQVWNNVEVIVAEDGGSDCASHIVSGFALPESKLRLIRQSGNVGAATNKLNAWRLARGDFIVNLDDDDLLEPDFVARLLPPLLDDPSVVLGFCDHFQINEQGDIDLAATDANTAYWKRNLLAPGFHRPFLDLAIIDQGIPFAMGSLWCKSRLNLDDFRVESGPSYDLYMAYVAARTGLAAYYVPDRLSKYRVHAGMETRQGRERICRANVFCNRKFLTDPLLAPWHRVFAGRLADAYASLAGICLRERKPLSAFAHSARSFCVRPSRRALAGMVYCVMPGGARRIY